MNPIVPAHEDRLIPRIPVCLDLPPLAVDIITQLCFVPDEAPTPCDTVFVFGTRTYASEAAATVRSLLVAEYAPHLVILTGGEDTMAYSTTVLKLKLFIKGLDLSLRTCACISSVRHGILVRMLHPVSTFYDSRIKYCSSASQRMLGGHV